MDSQQQNQKIPSHGKLQKFLFSFKKHWQNTYPKVFQSEELLKQIQRQMLLPTEQVNQVDVEDIQKQLTIALEKTPKSHRNGIMIIGPPGIGKTAFTKYYAKKHNKILINANCCELISSFRTKTIDMIDILFKMANFQKDTLLFFDQIDILMNDQNYFQKMQGQILSYCYRIRSALMMNATRQDFKKPVIYSTNKPWKIRNKQFLSTINFSIQISVSTFQKRKELIKMILADSQSFHVDASAIDIDDIAQRTLNYLNSDIYVLVRQILMQPYRQLIQNGLNVEQIKKKQVKITKQNIEKAYEKIKPSILPQEIKLYKQWKDKFQQENP